MAMQRLILLAAAALLGGCATGYTYHQSGGGDYYSGEPYTDYHYAPSAGFWYGYPGAYYGPYPGWGGGASYWGGYPGYYGGYYGGHYGGYYGGHYRGYYGGGYRGPNRPGHHHRPPPPPSTGGGGDNPGQLRDYRQVERFGPRGGNPPVMPRNIRRNEVVNGGMPPAPVSRPVQVRTPPPSRVVRPPPPARPATPSTARPSVTPSERHERAVDRGRVKSGSGDTP